MERGAVLYAWHSNILCLCFLVGDDHAPTDIELGKFAKQIALVWQTVGLELGLKQHDLNIIAENHSRSCEQASKVMLFKWRNSCGNPSYKVLKQAVENYSAYSSGSTWDF